VNRHAAASVRLCPPEREKQFQGAVIILARLNGFVSFHVFDSRRNQAGFPDLVLVKPPRLIFAELKSSHGRLSLAQGAWLTLLRRVPCVEVYVWRPEDKQHIAEVLSDRGARRLVLEFEEPGL
jgi:hypothetical protein